MKVVVAIDSFKGSLSSFQAGTAVKDGILSAMPDTEVDVCPIADGGEGTVDAILQSTNASVRRISVTGPLGRSISAYYGILNGVAIMEMAKASGLPLLRANEKNPMNTTTYGVGEMILDAIHQGCRKFIIGIGGSATNDGGVGMLQALGFEFLDKRGREVPYGAEGVGMIHTISTKGAIKELSECTFHIACDVTNPLCGELGCSAIFARQKGADDEMIKIMDSYLCHYADLTRDTLGRDERCTPGAGAAGGLGFAFISYLNAPLENGFNLIAEQTEIEEKIKTADIVVTGEGKLDLQTSMGKAPMGVATMAKKYGAPVIALAGSITDGAEDSEKTGIAAFFPVLREVCTLERAMETEYAKKNVAKTAEQVFKLLDLSKKMDC